MNPLQGAGRHGHGTVTKKMLETRGMAVPAQWGPSPRSWEEEETGSNRWGGRAEINWGELRVFGNVAGF